MKLLGKPAHVTNGKQWIVHEVDRQGKLKKEPDYHHLVKVIINTHKPLIFISEYFKNMEYFN